MGTIEKLLERNHVTITVDGMGFLCHRSTAWLALEAFGSNSLMVVHEGTPEESFGFDPDKVGNKYEIMQKYLAVAMISPRLGETDNVADDTVSWRSLGDVGPRLYDDLMSETQEDVAAFQESSEVQVE